MQLYYLLVFAISFLVTAKINFYNNNSKIQKLVLRWNNACFHVHHWITFTALLLALIAGRYLTMSAFNLLVVIIFGIISESFLFKDVFEIKKTCKQLLK